VETDNGGDGEESSNQTLALILRLIFYMKSSSFSNTQALDAATAPMVTVKFSETVVALALHCWSISNVFIEAFTCVKTSSGLPPAGVGL